MTTQFTNLTTIAQVSTPEEFVRELAKCKADVRIYSFMLELKARFYPEINMILYDDLSIYVGREKEFCIDARMYYKYSRLHAADYEFDLATCDPKSHIKEALERAGMKNETNYLLSHAREQHSSGAKQANRYMLTPESFYMLLMDIPDKYRMARQTFCKYHAFQTKVIKYYDNFQLELKRFEYEEQMVRIRNSRAQTQLIGRIKDESINRLEQAIQQQSAEIRELIGYTKEQRVELSEAREDIKYGNDMIENLTEVVEECREVIVERMDAHTINPESTTKKQYFMCLQHPDWCNVLYVIRSQKSNIRKQLKAHEGWSVVIESTEDPNSIKMFNRFKDRVNQITKDAKMIWKQQWKVGEITRGEYFANANELAANPLISINRNDIEFDSDQISLAQVISMMKDTTYERFMLHIP